MKTAAIICEFNPLHHGHAYILKEMRREADCVIAIMSGNFVQRAEPALLDKYARAELALAAGADLVVELPMPWCAASAEYFAAAGCAIAEMMAADVLAFGIGAEESAILHRAAETFLDPDVQAEIRALSQSDAACGIASVREKCLKSRLGADADGILRSPNDILAIEYLKQISVCGYGLQPQMIRRLTDAKDPRFVGATAIRDKLRSGNPASAEAHVPPVAFRRIQEAMVAGAYALPQSLAEIAFLSLRTDFDRSGRPVAEGEGGLMDRLYKAAQSAVSADEMLSAAATKKYTNARIRRVLLYYLLGIVPQDLRGVPSVTTLLAANAAGRAHLARIRKSSCLKILTKPSDSRYLSDSLVEQYHATARADALYTLCCRKRQPADYYLKQKPFQSDLNAE